MKEESPERRDMAWKQKGGFYTYPKYDSGQAAKMPDTGLKNQMPVAVLIKTGTGIL
jgi:hypothetical protein